MRRQLKVGLMIVAAIVVVVGASALVASARTRAADDSKLKLTASNAPAAARKRSTSGSASASSGGSNAGSYSSSRSVTQAPPSQEATLPPLGPGAVLSPDLAAAPVLPAGLSTSEYVTTYYQKVLAGDLEGAWAMLPKTAGETALADYQRLLLPYQPKGYWIRDVTTDPASETVTTLQFDPDNRSWNTIWTFVDSARGRVLKDVKYELPTGGACH